MKPCAKKQASKVGTRLPRAGAGPRTDGTNTSIRSQAVAVRRSIGRLSDRVHCLCGLDLRYKGRRGFEICVRYRKYVDGPLYWGSNNANWIGLAN